MSQEQFIPLRRPADAANVRAATVNFGWAIFAGDTFFVSSSQALQTRAVKPQRKFKSDAMMALSSIMQLSHVGSQVFSIVAAGLYWLRTTSGAEIEGRSTLESA